MSPGDVSLPHIMMMAALLVVLASIKRVGDLQALVRAVRLLRGPETPAWLRAKSSHYCLPGPDDEHVGAFSQGGRPNLDVKTLSSFDMLMVIPYYPHWKVLILHNMARPVSVALHHWMQQGCCTHKVAYNALDKRCFPFSPVIKDHFIMSVAI